MNPTDIFNEIKKNIVGQDEILQYVAVAVFKHIKGERFGNILLIGNSGTGKTTIMKAIEQLYNNHPAFEKFRVVIRTNANTLAEGEEGRVSPESLFKIIEEKARLVLGKNITKERLKEAMEHATICIDEVDKITSVIGNKPNVMGINIQQSLLTLMEGEEIVHETKIVEDNELKTIQFFLNTRYMLFICGGAFENLYDQVYDRVVIKEKRDLSKMVLKEDGSVEFRDIFTLKDFLRQEDLFEYGMLPQFISRFDNAIVLRDLSPEDLMVIFSDIPDSVFSYSKKFFENFNITLKITEKAKRIIAYEAAKFSRVGARALKEIYGRIIKEFEFDPFKRDEVKKVNDHYELVIDEEIVREKLALIKK